MRIVLVKLELQEQNKALLRIAEALERMSPPPPSHNSNARLSDVQDLRVVEYTELEMLQKIKQALAIEWKVVVDSPAYQERVREYEEVVRGEGGEDAVNELPWNSIGRRW